MGRTKCFAINGHAETDVEAISLCARKLFEEGCVTEDFAQNCIVRERNFPTGLPSAIPVAMPHSETSGALKDAVCVLILDEPVAFRRMDDDEQTIYAKMVFNLAITADGNSIQVLQKLMQMFYNKELLEKLLQTDLKKIPKMLDVCLEVNKD